ncbi:ABC-type dipeptide/oligopeptide/nickel transport system permease subunit [Bacillus mesophilus]|uniref:ABC transporter permease subunit n=1 Tax=Bacillus mesophilus TaxID=1808955 RepID=A0A6M0QAI5_9BACI|nr:ABC transporter permease subunit [Bacillus mesophilus]MBM7661868.1 ABC-type dipeptide/oligopeptide/nickel transport system permease subunit [Bacillus mesophilus]NEY72769.1 ABC transporter permease subunit [Bacillus mesophilus]
MLLLMNKMLRSFILLFLASGFIVYLVMISTDQIYFSHKTDWSYMYQAVLDYYRVLISEQSLGVSKHSLPVNEIVFEHIARSLKIIIPAYIISIIIGIPLGIIHFMVRNRKIQSKLHKVNQIIFGTVPDFFLLIAAQYGLLLLIRGKMIEVDLFGHETLFNLLFPLFIISITPVFYISNITYQSLLNEKDKDYVRTAMSKGTRELPIILKHLLWNAWPTILGYSQTLMLIIISSLPIIERLCSYKGAGYQLLASLKVNDTYTIIGLLLPFLVLVLISLWVTDLIKLIIAPTSLDQELSDDTISNANKFKVLKLVYYFLKTFPFKKATKNVLVFIKEYPSFALGVFILVGMAMMAILGPIMPFVDSKLEGFRIGYDENGKLLRAPLPPSSEYWFGTDREGRDLFSIIVHGARETFSELFFIVVLRFIISIPFGYFAAVHKGTRNLLGFSNSLLSFLPAIILVMLVGNLPSLQESYSRYALLMLVIAFLDIGRIGEIMRQEFTKINKTEYMVAAVSMGTEWYHIITRYYIPIIYQKIVYIFISDMARIMVLLGGLGIVQVYLAQDLKWDPQVGMTIENLTFTWPSLLSNSLRDIQTAPWIPFFPSLMIAVTIIGLNLFGIGLKHFIDDYKNKKQQEEILKGKNETHENWITNYSKENINL